MYKFPIPILCLILAGCKEEVAHNLNERGANRIISRFQSSGIETEKKLQADGRWMISIPLEKKATAIELLESEHLLPDESNGEQSSIALMASADERSFILERSLSKAIEQTLLSINGVAEAKVHLYRPREDLLESPRKEKDQSGSVLMIVTGLFTLSSGDVAALVGGAAGIQPDRVSVIISKKE
jgi:type III secretory pathway lipoprotein EscJ